MNVQRSTRRRRALATLAATTIAYAGITVTATAPASAGECTFENTMAETCPEIYNSGTVPIGIFSGWDRPVPGYPGTDDWNQYAQSHPDTATVIWDYYSHPHPLNPEEGNDYSAELNAALLPVGANSKSVFKDADGFYIGPGMSALVDVGSISHTCVIGPIYYKVYDAPAVNVYSGPSVC